MAESSHRVETQRRWGWNLVAIGMDVTLAVTLPHTDGTPQVFAEQQNAAMQQAFLQATVKEVAEDTYQAHKRATASCVGGGVVQQ